LLQNNKAFDQAAWQASMGSWQEARIDAAGNTTQFAENP
jgi:hypothetical protein